MKKNNVKIKNDIGIADEIIVIESIVDYYFTDGEYTPYYAEMGKVTAIAQNFLDGVEFDDEDYIYECVMNDDDLYKCVNKFFVPSTIKSDAQYYNRMERIMKQVEDIVEFKKQKLIHNTDAFGIIGDMCMALKDIVDQYVLKESGITEETLANAVRNAADQFKLPDNDIIEGQRQRIAEQQEQLQEKEAEIQDLRKWKREYMARNVKSVKGDGVLVDPKLKKSARKSDKK